MDLTLRLLPPCSMYPEIKKFVAQHAGRFGNLEVLQRSHTSPFLKLQLKLNGPEEILRVDAWKAQALKEFMEDRLEAAPASPATRKREKA